MALLSWLRRHSIRTGEAAWLVLVFLFGLYKALGIAIPLPSLPQEFTFPVLFILLAGLYISSKWSTWTARPRFVLSAQLQLDSLNVWRFTCWNKGPACEVRARVYGATDQRGNLLIDRQHLPIELPWTHKDGRRIRVGRNDRLGVTGALVAYGWVGGLGNRPFKGGRPRYCLFLYGDAWKPPLGQVSRFRNCSLAITVVVDSPEYPDVEPTEHTYHLTFDRSSPARFRATT